jgi:hypothetical protein
MALVAQRVLLVRATDVTGGACFLEKNFFFLPVTGLTCM